MTSVFKLVPSKLYGTQLSVYVECFSSEMIPSWYSILWEYFIFLLTRPFWYNIGIIMESFWSFPFFYWNLKYNPIVFPQFVYIYNIGSRCFYIITYHSWRCDTLTTLENHVLYVRIYNTVFYCICTTKCINLWWRVTDTFIAIDNYFIWSVCSLHYIASVPQNV